jgi:hypothetical protein
MRPFWQQLILSLLAPLTTAVIGTFLLGLWAAWITQRWQVRKEHAAIRESLIHELLETSSALYLALRHYEHLTDPAESWRDMPLERKVLGDVYMRTRTAGDAIQYRLMAYFASEDLTRKWHSMMDLLTTRYLQLVGSPPDSYLKVMEGPRHTTLSSAELASPERIFERYKEFAEQLPGLILSTPMARGALDKVLNHDAVGGLKTEALAGKSERRRRMRAGSQHG